jgi:hypothetical protein
MPIAKPIDHENALRGSTASPNLANAGAPNKPKLIYFAPAS